MSGSRIFLMILLFATCVRAQNEAQIEGTVADSLRGEALATVDVQLGAGEYRTRTDTNGHFRITGITPGDYLLRVSIVGYRIISTDLHLYANEVREFTLTLTPDTLTRVDTIVVNSGSPFDPLTDETSSQFSLSGTDLKNLGTVLADDPLRAVQSIPGVSSNDDFEARFSLRGAEFNRIGVYLDGVQLHDVVHTLQGTTTSGSNSIFNTDLIKEVTLYDGAYPSRFGDSSAGALDVQMRDGSPSGYSFKVMANFADAGLLVEGPLGRGNRCSWIGGYRKSYLQYLLQQVDTDPSMAFGFQDVQGRLTCKVNARNTLSLDVIDGLTDLDRTSVQSTLGFNSLMLSSQRFSVANLSWRFVVSDDAMVTSHFSWTRDGFNDSNPNNLSLGSGNYREWVWNSTGSWIWNSHNRSDAGFSVRQISESGYLDQYNSPTIVQILDTYRGSGILAGGYFEQSWDGLSSRLHLVAGGRWDRHTMDGVSAFSPHAGLSFSPWSSTEFQLGWGEYAQFPEISQFTSNLGSHSLLPMRSNQATASVQQRIGQRIRVRATIYDRLDRDLLYQSYLLPRIVDGVVQAPATNPLFMNSLRGDAHGVELVLQRVSANRLSGWISYSYGKTWMHDGVTGDSFPSDFDQRHTANIYATYRIRPTINLSAKWTYGSGFPIPAYLGVREPYSYTWGYVYSLGSERNTLSAGPYQRLDVRVNKVWIHKHWKTTLYGEVVNLTTTANYRYDNFEAYNGPTRLAYVTLDRMFPILPSVGVVFEH